MHVKQIAIFLENNPGRLADISHALASSSINIRALSLADTADFGILRLVVNDTDKAIVVLREQGFTVGTTDVLAIEVPDKPGGLDSILQVVKKAGLNVEYMYAFTKQSGVTGILLFRFEDLAAAEQAFRQANLKVLGGNEVHNL